MTTRLFVFLLITSWGICSLLTFQPIETAEESLKHLARRSFIHPSCAARVDALEDVFDLVGIISANAANLATGNAAYISRMVRQYFRDDSSAVRNIVRDHYLAAYDEASQYPGGHLSIACEDGGIRLSTNPCIGQYVYHSRRALTLILCHEFFQLLMLDEALLHADQVTILIQNLLHMNGTAHQYTPDVGDRLRGNDVRSLSLTRLEALDDTFTYTQFAKEAYLQLLRRHGRWTRLIEKH